MEKINIAELLKNCPNGMELDCTVYDNCTFKCILDENCYPIQIQTPEGNMQLSQYGCMSLSKYANCIIFPKGKTTWEGFQVSFKDGDLISAIINKNLWYGIYQKEFNAALHCYVSYSTATKSIYPSNKNGMCLIDSISEVRLATEEEKEKLFQAIKDNGYKWNSETKTLEKLPRFKVGDRVKHISAYTSGIIVKVDDKGYYINYPKGEGVCYISFTLENDYELTPNKFDISTLKPFESRVLTRDTDNEKWKSNFWGFYDIDNAKNYPYECCGNSFAQCIPYEGNEHLLGTKNDCDEFYKIWK